MGNIPSAELEKSDPELDKEILSLQTTALFNDSFITTLMEKIPTFGFVDPQEQDSTSSNSKVQTSEEAKTNIHDLRLEKFMTIFSNDLNNTGKVEDFPILSVDKSLANSGFAVMNQRRSRLLLRMFQAFDKQLEQIKVRSSSQGTSADSLFWQLPLNVDKGQSASDQEVLSNLSVGMSLALARTFGTQNSAVVKVILQTLLDSFLIYKPLSLQLTGGLQQTLDLICNFAADTMSSAAEQDVKELALSLQLSIGLIVGSVSTIIQTVEILSQHKWMINDRVMAVIATCSEVPVDFDVSFPNPKKPHDKFAFALDIAEEKKYLASIPQFISMTCDGTFYYIFDGVSTSVTKIGSGLNGSLCGEIIASSQSLKTVVPELVTASVDQPVENAPAQAAVWQQFSSERKSSFIELSENGFRAVCMSTDEEMYRTVYIDHSFPAISSDESLVGCTYFEVTIVGSLEDEEERDAIRVGFSTGGVPLDSENVSETEHSYSWSSCGNYDGENEIIVDSSDSDSESSSQSESNSCMFSSWAAGDIIGCGIDYDSKTIFYTRNGTSRACFRIDDLNNQNLFPCISFSGSREVLLNSGQSPFRYHGPLATGPMHHNSRVTTKEILNNSSHLFSSLAVVGDHVLLHFSNGLDSRQLAMIDRHSLEYVGNLDLSLALDTSSSNDDSDKHMLDDVYQFDYELSEGMVTPMCIRSTKGYEIKLLQASIEEVTITSAIESAFNSDHSGLFCSDIRKAIVDSNVVVPKTCVLKLQLRSSKKSASCLHLPIASTPTSLYVIEQTDGSSKDARRIYDAARDIQFRSVTFESGANEVDALNDATRNWFSFLEKYHQLGGDVSSETAPKEDISQIISSNSSPEPIAPTADGEVPQERDTASEKLTVVYSFGKTNTILKASFSEKVDWFSLIAEYEELVDKREPFFNAVKINIVERKKSFSAKFVKRYPLLTPGHESLTTDSIRSGSLLCNDHQLMIMVPSSMGKNSIRAKGWKFSLDAGGEIQRVFTKTFAEACGTPTTFAFDQANNMVVSFDSGGMRVLKWRNAGFSPIVLPKPKHSGDHHVHSECDKLLNLSPSERLDWLLMSNKKVPSSELQVAILLSLLDKLSEPYNSNVLGENSNLDALNQIKVVAIGSSDDEKNRCNITIRDQVVDFDDDVDDAVHHGYHIVVLNKQTFTVEKTRWYNTDYSPTESNRMGDFLNDLNDGSVILVACGGSIRKNVGRYATEALMNFGCCDLDSVAKGANALVMIGIKGLKPGSADLKIGLSNDPVQLTRFLPPTAIPLKLDPSAASITSLLHVCKFFLQNLKDLGSHSNLFLLASLRLLQVNLHTYTSRSSTSKAIQYLTSDRISELQKFLEELLSSKLMAIDSVRSASIGLFVASLSLVYPESADQARLLENIARKYIKESISEAELSLLEVLLRRLLRSDDLFEVKNNKLEFEGVSKLLDVVQLIVEKEVKIIFSGSELKGQSESRIFTASVNLLQSLAKQMLSFACSSMIVTTSRPTPSFTEANHVFRTVSSISKLASKVLQMVKSYLESHPCSAEVDASLILDILQHSPVGSILPIAVLTMTELTRNFGYQVISLSMESVLLAIEDIEECLLLINSVLLFLPSETRSYIDSAPSRPTSTHVYESPHPYRSNMDEETIMSFPGATNVVIVFDERSQTEDNCDYLQFVDKNKCSLHPQVEKFMGRNGNENWPGCKGRPPLTLTTNNFYMLFHSDGSVEDWGYKFTLTANYPVKIVRQNRLNWLLKLSFDLVQSMSVIGVGMIQGPEWKDDLETKAASWLENSLIKPECFGLPNASSADDLVDEHSRFLWGLIFRGSNSVTDAFMRKMKQIVQEDQGSDIYVNNAVYATCGAMIRTNNLTSEAIAIGNGTRLTPSSQLISTWKVGQRLRKFFDSGETRRSVESESNKGLLSMFTGSQEHILASASETVVERAKFLLRSKQIRMENDETPETDQSPQALISSPQKSVSGEAQLSPYGLVAEPSSTEKSQSASKKWQLASKAVKFQRHVSNETRNVAVMWHSLVDEAVVLDKLKNVFLQRRLFSERSRTEHEMTPSEKILQFVQSDVDLAALHEVNALRNKRAIVRSKGYDVFAKLLTANSSPFTRFIATSNYAAALRKFGHMAKSESELLHYAHSVEGCSPEQNNLLWQKFSCFLNNCVASIKDLVNRSSPEDDEAERELVDKSLVSLLRACALDFDPTDHQLVFDSDLGSCLESILRLKSTSLLSKQTASALMDIIVGRFMVFENSEMGPTKLSKLLISILANLLNSYISTEAVPLQTRAEVALAQPIAKLHEIVSIDSFSRGRSLGHVDLPYAHSICFSVGRGRSYVDSSDPALLAVGSLVTRSAFWSALDKNRVDGGIGSIGVIRTVLEGGKKALVKWNSGKEHVHTLGVDNEDEQFPEVVLADPSIAGYLFTKGSNAIGGSATSSPLNSISVQLLPDASLLVIYQVSGDQTFVLRSTCRISAERWVSVAIVLDYKSKLRLFIDGELNSSLDLSPLKWNEQEIQIEVTSSVASFEGDSSSKVLVWADSSAAAPSGVLNIVGVGDSETVIPIRQPGQLPGNDSAALLVSANAKFSFVEDSPGAGLSLRGRIVSDVELSSLSQSASRLPFYLGHPPEYFSSSFGGLVSGAVGHIKEFSVFATALPVSDIKKIHEQNGLGTDLKNSYESEMDEISVLNTLGTLRRSLSGKEWLKDTSLRRCFSDNGVVDMVFRLFSTQIASIQLAAYRLAASILPSMDIELVDGYALRHGLIGSVEESSFLNYLFESIGSSWNTWYINSLGNRTLCSMREGELSPILQMKLQLLRCFATGRTEWREKFFVLMKSLVESTQLYLSKLKFSSRRFFETNVEDLSALDYGNNGFVILALLGGIPQCRVGPGVEVRYTDELSGLTENATVLGPTFVPSFDKKDQLLAKKWASASHFGDVFAIFLDSDPSRSIVVPASSLEIRDGSALIEAEYFELIQKELGISSIRTVLQEVLSYDSVDNRVKREPSETWVDEERVFESDHPYPDGKEHTTIIRFDGAESIEISFDEMSRTESNCDYVAFFEDNTRKKQYGERYMGRDGTQNFPGCEGRPPVVIDSSSCVLYFFADQSGNDWGYKVTAKAKCRRLVYPPENPPALLHSLMCDLKMLAAKCILSLTQNCEWFASTAFEMMPQMMQAALEVKPSTQVISHGGTSFEDLTFESTHPYADSLDVYTPVCIPGAIRYVVTFDPETRTENNCDYLIFYTDSSHEAKVPDSDTYTGGKDGSPTNWPGINGKPALIIEGESFEFYFHSDSSVNDWGYRMYVVAELSSQNSQCATVIRGKGMCGAVAEQCGAMLRGLVHDGIAPVDDSVYLAIPKFRQSPMKSDAIGFAECLDTGDVSDSIVFNESKTEEVMEESKDAEPLVLPISKMTKRNPIVNSVFATVDFAVDVMDSCDDSASKVDHCEVGQKILIIEYCRDFVRVHKVANFSAIPRGTPTGWIPKFHSSGSLNYSVNSNESLLVMELTDEQITGKKATNSSSSNPGTQQEYKNPMYSVVDKAGTAANVVTRKETVKSASVIVGQDYSFLEQAIAEYTAIAAAEYSSESVALILEKWPSHLSFSRSGAATTLNLLKFLNDCIASDVNHYTGPLIPVSKKGSKALGLLKLLVRDASSEFSSNVNPRSCAAVRLLTCARSMLSKASFQESQSPLRPVYKGKQMVVESPHPYDNNMNQDWPIEFPGAKRLELRFASESTTETTYDYVTIYTDISKTTKAYNEKIHGYKSASQKHWPGVNVPPVVIEGDKCVINFVSDGGTFDWGFKVTVFAVMDEPSNDELKLFKSCVDKPSDLTPQLALAIIHFMSMNVSLLPDFLRDELFSVVNFRMLIKFFNSPTSHAYRNDLLEIFVVFIATISNVNFSSAVHREIFAELLELERSLIGFTNEQYDRETSSGTRIQGATPALQSAAQMLIGLQSVISDFRENENQQSTTDSQLVLRTLGVFGSPPGQQHIFYHPEATSSKSAVVWEIFLKRVVGLSPSVGLLSDIRSGRRDRGCVFGMSSQNGTEIAITDRQLLVNGVVLDDAVNNTKYWKTGDIITLKLDRLAGTLHYAVNGASMPVIVGPPTKYPCVEMNIVGLCGYLAIGLFDPLDEIEVRSVDDTIANPVKEVKPTSRDGADWLQPLREVRSILSCIASKKIPESIINTKLLPFCNKKGSLHWMFDDLTDGVAAEKSAMLEGAVQVCIAIQEINLLKDDVFEIVDSNGSVLLSLPGDKVDTARISNWDAYISKISTLGIQSDASSKLSSSSTPKASFKEGDKVVRGTAWEYGNEDGGAGSIGQVSKIISADGNKPEFVTVRWPNDVTGRYNAAQVTFFDERMYACSRKKNVHCVKHADSTVSVHDEAVTVRIRCKGVASPESERKAVIHLVPCYSISVCMNDPRFSSFRSRLESLYVIDNRAALAAVSKHVNNFARAKSFSRDDLLTKKWSDMQPSADDLLRSVALKALVEREGYPMSQEDKDISSQQYVFATANKKHVSTGGVVENEAEQQEGEGEGEGEESNEIAVSEAHNNCYLQEYATWGGIHEFESLEFALMAARQVYPSARGITQEGPQAFTLRAGSTLLPSTSGETSWLLIPPRVRRSVAFRSPVSSSPPPAVSMFDSDTTVGVVTDQPSSDIVPIEVSDVSNIANAVDEEASQSESIPAENFESIDGELREEDVSFCADEADDDSANGDEQAGYDIEYTESVEHDDDDDEGAVDVDGDEDDDDGDDDDDDDDDNIDDMSELAGLFDEDEPEVPTASTVTEPVQSLPCCHNCNKALRLQPAGTWGMGWSCDWPEHTGPNTFNGSDQFYGCDTVMGCNWGVCLRCWETITAKLKPSKSANDVKTVSFSALTTPVEAFYDLLQLLNHSLVKALPLIDLARNEKIPGTLNYLISSNRDLIFETVKRIPFDDAVSSTTGSGSQFELPLSRFRARRFAAAGKVDNEGRWSVFSQAFRVMHFMNPASLRKSDRLYTTKFMGEHAQDAGGPYRESFDNYAEELQSSSLPLFIRTPNGRHAAGYNREKWILNPSATSSIQLEMFSFVGKLMGIAIRSKEYMSLNIPSMIWKLIAGEVPNHDDLKAIDASLVSSIDLLRNIDQSGVDEDSFSSTFFETFTTTSSDDRIVELLSGGKNVDVTFHNRHQYCDLVLQYRLHEFDRQALAIREGLATIVPVSLLTLFRWDELEVMVCGTPEIDVQLLRNIAEYSSCTATDPHVLLFWQAMNEFNNEERSAFIKFAWGRSRLPLTAEGFTQRFKLQNFDRTPPDNYLPAAHTCFFSVDLPRYSSLQIMKDKLRYAIFNCQAIDGDETSTGNAIAAMGWDDEEN